MDALLTYNMTATLCTIGIMCALIASAAVVFAVRMARRAALAEARLNDAETEVERCKALLRSADLRLRDTESRAFAYDRVVDDMMGVL